MCGIFAFVGSSFESRADRNMLTEVARGAAQRGPHGYGWISDGVLRHDLDSMPVDQIPQGNQIVGHARLSTIGRNDRKGLQPILVDGHVFAHNGNVYNYKDLGWTKDCPSDSYVIANYYADLRAAGKSPEESLCGMVAASEQNSWAIVILDREGDLITHRSRLPLHQHKTADGIYVSSVPFMQSELIPSGFADLTERVKV